MKSLGIAEKVRVVGSNIEVSPGLLISEETINNHILVALRIGFQKRLYPESPPQWTRHKLC
jgi:hypothetical protein